MKNCPQCGTPLHEYHGIRFCPNCDPKPYELEEKEKNKEPPSYVG